MLRLHRRLFAFDHWANLVVLDALEPAVDRVPKALDRLNHIVGASRVWLARVTGEPGPFGPNPSFSAAALRREIETACAEWNLFLETQSDAGLSRVIAYTDTHRVALGDILTHVPIHGQHHRGQINVDLRDGGIMPPSIDYVHAARRGLF